MRPSTEAAVVAAPRSERFLGSLSRVLATACAVLAAGFMVLFVWVAAHRAAYPFDLEWMEGGMVDHVSRVLEGKELYVRPSVDFVPFIYNPFFYWVSAGIARFIGLDFLSLRLVSVASTVTSFALIAGIVRHETRATLPALLAAGLYAGTYALSKSWLDLARVDSLAMALCLGSVLVARVATGRRGFVAAAALSALAFGTRQNTGFLVPGLFLALAGQHGAKRSLEYAIPAVLFIALSVAVLCFQTSGWYWFYAVTVPLGHDVVPMFFLFFWKETLLPLAVATAFALFYFVEADRTTRAFYGASCGALIAMACAGRVHSGSYLNDDIPAYAALSVLFGLGAHGLLRNDRTPRALATAYAAVLTQLLLVAYDPRPWLPTTADREEGARLLRAIASYPGDVFLPQTGHIATRVGKRPFSHFMAAYDLLRLKGDPRHVKTELTNEFESALRERRFSAIILSSQWGFQDAMERYYRPMPENFVTDETALNTKVTAFRPRLLYLPR